MAAPKTTDKSTPKTDDVESSGETPETAKPEPAKVSPHDAVLKAREVRGAAQSIAPGTVLGAEDGYRYQYIVVRDYPADGRQVAAIRKHLLGRGFEACTGPEAKAGTGAEFVVGEPDAEIWRVSQAIADDEWKDEFLANLRNPSWFELQRRRGNHGIAKKVLQLAVAYHDSNAKDHARDREDAAQRLEALVRATPILGLQVHY